MPNYYRTIKVVAFRRIYGDIWKALGEINGLGLWSRLCLSIALHAAGVESVGLPCWLPAVEAVNSVIDQTVKYKDGQGLMPIVGPRGKAYMPSRETMPEMNYRGPDVEEPLNAFERKVVNAPGANLDEKLRAALGRSKGAITYEANDL